jgi:hypothetical protein
MHSSHMLREGTRPEIVRDNMGHANIDVTQNVYGKSWWKSEWMRSPKLPKPTPLKMPIQIFLPVLIARVAIPKYVYNFW